MFLILVVVQFIVITKGSERVAEVAARFTLDAMPGKQMSIDADLNAGLINEQQARERRRKLNGKQISTARWMVPANSSKVMRSHAIIILIINLLGGFIIGMAIHGMSFAESLQTFSILTIGDGLVSQIPALLISTATGLIVTRAASDGNLAHDITDQLFSLSEAAIYCCRNVACLGLVRRLGRLLRFLLRIVLVSQATRMQKT